MHCFRKARRFAKWGLCALACLRQSARFRRSMALLDPAVGLAAALLAPAFGAVTVGDDWAAAAPAGNAAAAIPNIDANRDMTRIRLPGRNSRVRDKTIAGDRTRPE